MERLNASCDDLVLIDPVLIDPVLMDIVVRALVPE
jgi:hypothetical protein